MFKKSTFKSYIILFLILFIIYYFVISITNMENFMFPIYLTAFIFLADLLLTFTFVEETSNFNVNQKTRENVFEPLKILFDNFNIELFNYNFKNITNEKVENNFELLDNVITEICYFKEDFNKIVPYMYLINEEKKDFINEVENFNELINCLFVKKWYNLNKNKKIDKLKKLIDDGNFSKIDYYIMLRKQKKISNEIDHFLRTFKNHIY